MSTTGRRTTHVLGSAVLVAGEPWLVYSGNLLEAEHQTVCIAAPQPGLERWISE